MSTRLLPERADLAQLKKQAKELLAEVQSGDPAAVARVLEVEKGGPIAAFALHDAQRVVAREYGFISWAKLKLHVETRTVDAAEARLIEAVLNHETEVVKTLLVERPALATRSSFTAAALGDASALNAELLRNPQFARSKGGPRDWEPLLYVCFGRVGGGDRERAAIARQLLASGANPNAFWVDRSWPESPLPALYGATGVNNFPELARVLLVAGANPNDGESRYHAAEHHHVECLDVLAEFGVDLSGADKTWGNTPLYFLFGYTHPSDTVNAGITWLLEHGANPNVISHAGGVAETALHAAVRHDWGTETIEQLLRHGADMNARRADGRTAYALAVSSGREAIAKILERHGARREVSETDEFLGACLRADEGAARELLRRKPDLVGGLSAEDRKVVLLAAQENRAAAIQLMGDVGFDLEVIGENGERALHWGAWRGWVETVRVLIARGVVMDACDRRFGAPPTGWCAHGSEACVSAEANHAEAMKLLVDAGAFVAPGTEGSPAVMAVLKKR